MNDRGLLVAAAATFTADPLAEVIDFWLEELGLGGRVELAPYGQVFQELLDPGSLLGSNGRGLDVVLVRLDDWRRGDLGDAGLSEAARDLARAVLAAASRSTVPHLVCFCPGPPDAGDARDIEEVVAAELRGAPGVQVITADELAALYPVARWADAHGDALGRIPYTAAFFAALGAAITRRLWALTQPPSKVIVVDGDHTLWSGVAAEDGPRGVAIDPPRRALGELLLAQRDAGALLCLASRNEEADVRAIFEERGDLPLRFDDFAARRIGWGRKSVSLHELAGELGLGLDAFVFLDDSPIERAEVRAGCPGVLVPELPDDPVRWPAFLRGVWALDRIATTAEDRARGARLGEERRRDALRRSAPTFAEFLEGLGLEVAIRPLGAEAAARAAQLTQRVNQLNVSTRRRTEPELRAIAAGRELLAFVVEARDRFGDYGAVGLMLAAPGPEALVVDTLLLSCRALGRGVEHRMLAHLGRAAVERGLPRVDVPFVPTPRNRPARDLLESASPLARSPEDEGVVYRFASESLQVFVLRAPPPDAPAPAALDGASSPVVGVDRSGLLQRIASDLADAEAIAAAVEARRRRLRPARTAPRRAPETAEETALAAIWREVLGLADVGTDESFFELGGQSVRMIQVVSRIRDAFGVEVPPSAFFEGPTIRELAGRVAALRVEAAAPGDLAALLDAVEALPDEAVQRLLAQQAATTSRSGADLAQGDFPAGPLEAIGIPTCDRPAALARSAESYLENAARHGRAPCLVVVDDSKTPAGRAATREALVALARRGMGTIRYAGAEEKASFAARLAELGLPADVVRFALLPVGAFGSTAGANRNSLLLDRAGHRLFSADDDTLCRATAPPSVEDGVAVVTGRDPADHWFYPDRETALATGAPVDEDHLALHEAHLGSHPGRLLDGADLRRADPAFVTRLAAEDAAVLVTFAGLAGDSGWGAPFGVWHAPMGYLAMEGASFARLTASEAAYRSATTSRAIYRAVSRPTLADASFGMTTFAGLDARRLLPPFCPVGRGQDNLFLVTLSACFPGAGFLHLPRALVHDPAPARRFWQGEMARGAAGVDVSRVLIECVRGCAIDAALASPAARMRALGARLEELGRAPPEDLDAFLRRRLAITGAAVIASLEARVLQAGGEPAFWASDVRAYTAALREAMTRDDYPVALDLVRDSIADARAQTRDVIRRFGELLRHWPAIVEASLLLRERGRPLAVAVRAEAGA